MGHVNAGLEFLIAVFNDMWPLVLATFVGAWMAFKHHRHQEARKEVEARARALRHAQFVIAGQTEQLQQIWQVHLEPHENNVRRAHTVDAVVVHKDFPGLDMNELPSAFDDADFRLMNQLTDAEQSFFVISRILRKRAARLAELDELDVGSPEGRKRQQVLEKSLEKLSNRLYEILPGIIERNQGGLKALKDYMAHRIKNNDAAFFVDYSSWYFLAVSCAIAGVFFFSHWAINARSLLEAGLDITLVSAVVFAVSLYASLAVGILVAVLSMFSLVKRLKSFAIYFWTFLISLQPTVFLLWLDVS